MTTSADRRNIGVPVQRRPSGAERTSNDQTSAVLRSIRAMRGNLGEEHSLHTLARCALLSPFHFHRVFRQITESTPARFLAAWRMAEAKRLLLYSSTSVTDICMQVGYSSLGTFTSQFTRAVGVSPGRFRRLLRSCADDSFGDLLAEVGAYLPEPAVVQAQGDIAGDADPDGLAVVGLFPSRIPQERPMACAILRVPGIAGLGGLPDGEYHPLAMSFPPTATVAGAMVDQEPDRIFVGASPVTVRISDGVAVRGTRFPLRLRPWRQTDPPLVLAWPLLIAAEAIRSASR